MARVARPFKEFATRVRFHCKVNFAPKGQSHDALPDRPATLGTPGDDHREIWATVAALPVQSPMQIPDLPYFSQQLQQELVRRLEAGFQPRASSTEAPPQWWML